MTENVKLNWNCFIIYVTTNFYVLCDICISMGHKLSASKMQQLCFIRNQNLLNAQPNSNKNELNHKPESICKFQIPLCVLHYRHSWHSYELLEEFVLISVRFGS